MNSLATDPLTTPPPERQLGPARRARAIRTILIVLTVVVAGVMVAVLTVDRLKPHLYAGTVLQQSEEAPPLDDLRFASGEPVDLGAFENEVVLVFFGYTNCPDVCPMTLSTVSWALDEMDADDRDRVNLMMVSVDPDRDELASLQEYVGFFDPSFRGVGGPQDAIARAATLYGVYYNLDRAGSDDRFYLVDHTATLMGIGPDGAMRVIWSTDVSVEALAADLTELLS